MAERLAGFLQTIDFSDLSSLTAKLTNLKVGSKLRNRLRQFRTREKKVSTTTTRLARFAQLQHYKRNMLYSAFRGTSDAGAAAGGDAKKPPSAASEREKSTRVDWNKLRETTSQMNSPDVGEVYAAVGIIRRMLSVERFPPIQEVIDVGAIPRLVELLTFKDHPRIQFESAWALTNLASGNTAQTHAVINAGVVPIFVELLESPDNDVRSQACWALGNISGDGPSFRDLVLNHGAAAKFVTIALGVQNPLDLRRNAAWTICNFCRGRPFPSFHLVEPISQHLGNLVGDPDLEINTDSCWALAYLSEYHSASAVPQIEKLIVMLRGTQNISLLQACLRALGNLLSGNAEETLAVVEAGILPIFKPLLQSEKSSIRKEVCWSISNIVSDGPMMIEQVIQADLLQLLINTCTQDSPDVQKEGIFVICNIFSEGNEAQVAHILDLGCLRLLKEGFRGAKNVITEGVAVLLRKVPKLLFSAKYFEEFAEEAMDNGMMLQKREDDEDDELLRTVS
eukprot:m.232363 g.232363  ORF g.232363 m.232363 type:complete len:509 (+) comp22440_c3_seq1:167-1693(+)